jgi:hypothetical protein
VSSREPCTQGHLRKYFLKFSHPGTQRPLQPPRHSETTAAYDPIGPSYCSSRWQALALSKNTVFSGMQKCKCYGRMEASTQISKESLGDQVMCGGVRIPAGSPWGGDARSCEGSLGCHGDPRMLEMPGIWNVCQGKLQATSGTSPGERSQGLQTARPQGQGFPAPQNSQRDTTCPGHWT